MISYKRIYRKHGRKKRNTRRRQRVLRGGNQNKCIYVKLTGRLGNQLFIYASAIVVKQTMSMPLCIIEPTSDEDKKDFPNYKDIFKQADIVNFHTARTRWDSAKPDIDDKLLRIHYDWSGIKLPTDKTVDYKFGSKGPTTYQNYKAIESALETIRADCKDVFEKRFPGFKESIPAKSAFLHVRRGDYITQNSYNVNETYYKESLDILTKDEKIEAIYVLSDEIQWCKDQKWDSSKLKYFDSEQESKDVLKSVYLMSLCLAGACTSASTFGLWGIILGADQNKSATILYPGKWVTDHSTKSLMFPSWWKELPNEGK